MLGNTAMNYNIRHDTIPTPVQPDKQPTNNTPPNSQLDNVSACPNNKQ
jgi:hypothetical protein